MTKPRAKTKTAKSKAPVETAGVTEIGGKKLYKVIGSNGESISGGGLSWSLPKDGAPGEWHEVDGVLRMCSWGLHLTTDPLHWIQQGARVFEVEAKDLLRQRDGEVSVHEGCKCVAKAARLVRELNDQDLAAFRIFRSGTHAVTDEKCFAYDSAQVTAYGSAQVTASGSAQVTAYGSAQVTASDSAQVTASGSAQVTAYGSAQVTASGSAKVTASDSAQVTASGSAKVTASDSAKVTAYGSAQVTASGSAKVTAYGSVVVCTPKSWFNSAQIVIADSSFAVHVDHRDGKPFALFAKE